MKMSNDFKPVHLHEIAPTGTYSMSFRVIMIAKLVMFLSNKPCYNDRMAKIVQSIYWIFHPNHI